MFISLHRNSLIDIINLQSFMLALTLSVRGPTRIERVKYL